MVPSRLIRRDAMPLLPNFKVDRAAVRRDDAALPAAAAPGPEASATALAILEEASLLLRRPVGAAEEDLLALGADSMLLVELSLALERRFGHLVPVEAILATRTARRLATWLDRSSAQAPPRTAALVRLRTGGHGAAAPLLWGHCIGNALDKATKLLPEMPSDRDWLGLRDPAGNNWRDAAETLEEHATLLLATLRASGVSPDPGAIPIGWSFGGRLAWEVGAQMAAAGWRVPCVIAIDAPAVATARLPILEATATDTDRAVLHRYRLAKDYTATPAPLDLVLLRGRHTRHLAHLPRHLDWAGRARRVEIIDIDADHFNMWQEPQLLAQLAEALQGAVAAFDPAG
jgi:thioesterase domain-containing protein/acyl carrier protein